MEKVLAASDEARVNVGVKHAKRRLAEIQILVEEKQEPKIVNDTLEALKTTTQEVVAVTKSKPELINHAVDLATEEEKVLTNVAESQAPGEVKTAVQNAITETQDSLSKLAGEERQKPGNTNETVQGTEITASSTPTTTPTTTRAGTSKPKVKDGTMESQMQIHGATSGSAETPPTQTEPEILSEPASGF